MGLNIASLIGGNVGDAIKGIIGAVHADPTVVEQNKEKLTEIQLNLQKQLVDQFNQQIEVNKIEAANPHIWVAGWRPAVGWVCAAGFAVQFLIAPIATWIAALCHHPVTFPTLDMTTMLSLLGGMLGLGGLRTYEKTQSIDTKNFA